MIISVISTLFFCDWENLKILGTQLHIMEYFQIMMLRESSYILRIGADSYPNRHLYFTFSTIPFAHAVMAFQSR